MSRQRATSAEQVQEMVIRPSDYARQHAGKGHVRLQIRLAEAERAALDIVAHAKYADEYGAFDQAFCWAVGCGLVTLGTQPALGKIRRSRQQVEVVGDAGNLAMLDWRFTPGWQRGRREELCVPRALKQQGTQLAKGFGLDQSALYGLAIAYGLIGETLPEWVDGELTSHRWQFWRAMRMHSLMLMEYAGVVQSIHRKQA